MECPMYLFPLQLVIKGISLPQGFVNILQNQDFNLQKAFLW